MAINAWRATTNGNWGTATNWTQGTVPTAVDGHVTTFDATSPNCTIDTSQRACNAIDFTGFTNTITFTQSMFVNGSITLSATMTFAGAGALGTSAIGTLTSNGKVVNVPFTLAGGSSYALTLADAWTVTGLVTLGSGSTICAMNGFSLTCTAGFTHGHSNGAMSGTTTIILTGTGTITGASGSGVFRMNLTFNTAGTLTFAAAAFNYDSATLTYTAGTIVTTGSTLTIGTSTTLNTSGITWINITLTAALTLTINSALRATGTFSWTAAGTIVFAGSAGWDVNTVSDTSGTTRTLAAGVTYRVRTLLTDSSSKTAMGPLNCSTVNGTKAILTLDASATQEVAYTAATDIDSSGGQEIKNYQGTNTRCVNWVVFPTRRTTAQRAMVG